MFNSLFKDFDRITREINREFNSIFGSHGDVMDLAAIGDRQQQQGSGRQ